MTNNAKWGGVLTAILVLAILWLFSPSSTHLQAEIPIEDQTLVSTASSLHPVEVFSINAPSQSIQEAFAAANVPYYPEDRISYFPHPSLGLGTVVTVQRALPVNVADGKRIRTLRTWSETVGELLEEKKIDLGTEDRITPALGTKLATAIKISIIRVARTTVSEFETITFKTIEQDDNSMWRGERQITQEGRNGKLKRDFLVIREDGELISRTLVSTTTVEQAMNKIIKVGTKLKIGKTVNGKATWYNCCGTKVASDSFKRGTEIRITNMSNGRSIIVRVDGCICGNRPELAVDLHPSLFQQLGGVLGQGIISSIRAEEILN